MVSCLQRWRESGAPWVSKKPTRHPHGLSVDRVESNFRAGRRWIMPRLPDVDLTRCWGCNALFVATRRNGRPDTKAKYLHFPDRGHHWDYICGVCRDSKNTNVGWGTRRLQQKRDSPLVGKARSRPRPQLTCAKQQGSRTLAS